jgi:hypothetical protein
VSCFVGGCNVNMPGIEEFNNVAVRQARDVVTLWQFPLPRSECYQYVAIYEVPILLMHIFTSL